MTDIKHTPGPWIVYPETDGMEVYAVDMKSGLPIRAPVARMFTRGNWSANAYLITAAPDLLEALVALDDDWTSEFPDGPDTQLKFGRLADETLAIWRKARAAIAKARGEA